MITGTGAILFFICLFISRFLEERVELIMEHDSSFYDDVADPYYWADFFAVGKAIGFVIMLVGLITWFFKELP